jgi:hypothetical protein
VFKQENQRAERLLPHLDARTASPHFQGASIDLKDANFLAGYPTNGSGATILQSQPRRANLAPLATCPSHTAHQLIRELEKSCYLSDQREEKPLEDFLTAFLKIARDSLCGKYEVAADFMLLAGDSTEDATVVQQSIEDGLGSCGPISVLRRSLIVRSKLCLRASFTAAAGTSRTGSSACIRRG